MPDQGVLAEKNLQPSELLTDTVRAFLADAKYGNTHRDAFLLALGIAQLSQKAATFRAPPAPTFFSALSSALSELSGLKWSHVNFSVAGALTSQTYSDLFTIHSVKDTDRHTILLQSLCAFLNVLALGPEYATEAVLRGIVQDEILNFTNAATPIELNYRANILKLFAPVNVEAIDIEPLKIVIYQGELSGGGFGPELWGLALPSDKEHLNHLLLETGEYVQVPETTLMLAAAKDYSTSEIPPYLLACARIFFPPFIEERMPELVHELPKLMRNLGSFVGEPDVTYIHPDALADCGCRLDTHAITRDHADTGVTKFLQNSSGDLRAIIDAHASKRPYITSALLDSADKVHMRLDTPREFSAYGVYLFPSASINKAVAFYSYPPIQ